MFKQTLKRGFTLTEILLVILIIALLMAFILPQILRGPAQARDAARIQNLGTLAVAMESYRNANRQYPTGPECLSPTSNVGRELIDQGFISEANFPVDPSAKNTVGTCQGTYYYKTLSENGVSENAFVLFARLETGGRANASESDVNGMTSTSHSLTKGDYYAKLSF